jgi:hypothetical protein
MKKNEGKYEKLLKEKNQENDSTITIDKDLDRTFPEHPFFNSKSVKKLKRVLYAFTYYKPSIGKKKTRLTTTTGYCQCFNFIVGSLLFHMEEEEAFWTFVCILEGRTFQF